MSASASEAQPPPRAAVGEGGILGGARAGARSPRDRKSDCRRGCHHEPVLVTESLRAVVVSDPEQAAEYEAAWDELAVSTASPYSAPAWMLAWWRHVAPARAQLRLVFSFDGSDLVGVAPFWSRRQPAPVRS